MQQREHEEMNVTTSHKTGNESELTKGARGRRDDEKGEKGENEWERDDK